MPRKDGTYTMRELAMAANDCENETAYAEYLAAEEAEEQAQKGWPAAENCPGCPGHIERGPHKMSCTHSSRRWILTVRLNGEAPCVVPPEGVSNELEGSTGDPGV